MSFEDLPKGVPWDARDDTTAGNVVDLCLGARDRAANSLLVLLCDPGGEVLKTPVVIADVPWDASADERTRAFGWLEGLADAGLSIVVAFGRRGREVSGCDRAWARSAHAAAARWGVPLLSCWVAGDDAVLRVTDADLAA